jgi:hypothetical protein
MSPAELRDLADGIAANGQHEPIALTPDGRLLEGRNRWLACAMAGVEPKTFVYDGDPWLYPISKNARRRHMTVDQIAMVVAELATRSRGERDRESNPSNEGFSRPTVAEVAKAASIPKTAVESAKVVRERGSEEQKAAVVPARQNCARPPTRYGRRHARPRACPTT